MPDDVQIGLRDRFSAVPEPDAHDGNECGVLDLFDVGLLLNAEALMTEKSEHQVRADAVEVVEAPCRGPAVKREESARKVFDQSFLVG